MSSSRIGAPAWVMTSGPEQPRREPRLDLVDRDPLLRHGVALADRHRVVLEGVEVDGDAVGRADLVLAAVALADGLRVVEVDVPVAAQLGGQVAGALATWVGSVPTIEACCCATRSAIGDLGVDHSGMKAKAPFPIRRIKITRLRGAG